MAFWGVEVKPAKPFTLIATPNDSKRLHLSQATLGLSSNKATAATTRSIIQCNVGNKSPLFLCVLSPDNVDSCQLNIEFQEAEDVIFSVIGPRSVHLTGYFLGRSSTGGLRLNDDESESFGEDIVDTDVEKGSSDDYDYSDSFINDDDPSAHTDDDDDDELTVKEKVAKTKAKKRNKRLRKKFQVSDSESSDETSSRAANEDSIEILDSDNDDKTTKVLSPEAPLPASRVTRSKARCSNLENGEKTSEATTHTHKTVEEKEEKTSVDVEPSGKNDSEVLSKKEKKKKKRNKESVVINTDEGEEKDMPETQKPETDKAKSSKKKRKKDRRNEETTERKKQAIDMNMKKEASTKKLAEPELSPNEVTVEEIEKGKSDGKVAVQGKKVSILFTGKLKDSGKVFESNLEESPLRFRLGGGKVIKGLSNGVEGMRVGDKRRIIIPPSLGYSDQGLNKEDVPKNSWLVYDVEAVKV